LVQLQLQVQVQVQVQVQGKWSTGGRQRCRYLHNLLAAFTR
jgi:hypothetical protein